MSDPIRCGRCQRPVINCNCLETLEAERGIAQTPRLETHSTAPTTCICAGNWRQLVQECEPLFDKWHNDSGGSPWLFFGLVWASDDLYYGMCNNAGAFRLLSCVGDLAGHGYTPLVTLKELHETK